MRSYYCLMLLLLAGSCQTVSVEQLKIVQQIANMTKRFSAYPEKICSDLTDIRDLVNFYREVDRIHPMIVKIDYNLKF